MKSHQLKVVGAAVALVLSLALSAAEAPFVSAHAGAMGTRANTLESVKALVKTKVDALELAHLDRLAALKPWAYNTCHAWLSPAAAAALKARGLRISLWTANSPESFDKFVKQGAYNVTTTWIPPKLTNTAPAK